MIDFFTGLGGKLLGGLLLAVLLGGGLTVAVREHDQRVLALAQVSQDKAIQAAQAAASTHEIQALQSQEATLRADADISAALKVQTHAAPRTVACAASPAVNAWLNGLRSNSGANGSGARPTGSR